MKPMKSLLEFSFPRKKRSIIIDECPLVSIGGMDNVAEIELLLNANIKKESEIANYLSMMNKIDMTTTFALSIEFNLHEYDADIKIDRAMRVVSGKFLKILLKDCYVKSYQIENEYAKNSMTFKFIIFSHNFKWN